MKVGPYFLQQGVMANTSDKKEAMNTVRTLLKDVPVGYEVAHTGQVNKIINFMYNSGEVFGPDFIKKDEVPPFFDYKRYILHDDNNNKYGIFALKPKNPYLTPYPEETIGQALLVRKSDFKFM